MRSVQAARWTRTWNYSWSLNLASNSNTSKPPPSTNRAEPIYGRIWSGAHHSFPIQFLSRPWKVTGPKMVAKGLMAFTDKRCFTLQFTLTFNLGVWFKARKGVAHLSPPHRVLRQGSVQVSQSFSEPVVIQIRHTSTPVTQTLTTDLSTDQSNLESDRWSASWWFLGRSTDKR